MGKISTVKVQRRVAELVVVEGTKRWAAVFNGEREPYSNDCLLV
jgi:hypothetical protein